MSVEATLMSESRVRVRANRTTGELEIEGPAQAVEEWWHKLWPELAQVSRPAAELPSQNQALLPSTGNLPEVFGEFYTEFRSDITDVDKVLVAAAFVQGKDQERVFTTKAANLVLLDQNIKVTNASENVRRLIQTKRAFVISEGKYRVSTGGFEHLSSLKVNS
jgi:hypothetical protein